MKKKILVADDNRTVRLLVKANLEVAGYTVIEAENGKEALKKSLEEKPDLILLDVVMPEVDGFEVLASLKSKKETKNMPVIMLTSLGSERHQVLGWKGGADDYIVKPFNPAAAVETVNKVFKKREEDKRRREIRIEKLKLLESLKEEDES